MKQPAPSWRTILGGRPCRRTFFLSGLGLVFFAMTARAFDFSNIDLGQAASGGSKLFKAAAGLSDKDEINVGRDVAANLAARYSLVEDPVKLHYLNLIGQTLVHHSSRKNIPYHFGILKSVEINAMAAPGGYVFVTDGLLTFVQDESELAGVLAHEISHVTQRHVVKAIRQANAVEAGQDFSAASGHDLSSYSQLSDFTINLLNNGLSRTDELAADQLGTALATEAGYDPAGLRRSVERLEAREKSDVLLARFNKTHPPAADRLRAIDQTIDSHHGTAQGQRLADRFKQNIIKK